MGFGVGAVDETQSRRFLLHQGSSGVGSEDGGDSSARRGRLDSQGTYDTYRKGSHGSSLSDRDVEMPSELIVMRGRAGDHPGIVQPVYYSRS